MRGRTRPNGTGTAYKRGKSWQARVVIGWKSKDGKSVPVWRTKDGFPTKREALEYCAVLLDPSYQKEKRVPTLADYWQSYESVELAKLSKSKQTAYRIAWRKLSELHRVPVNRITVTMVRDVVAGAAPTFYPAKDCKTLLTRLFELAGADGVVSKDIPSYIIPPKLEEKEREAFTREEQSALWKLYETGDMTAAIPLLMICTGMMPGEMQALRVENINTETRTITGVGMKTKVRKQSQIYIPEDAMLIIEDLIANAQPTGYLWPRNKKKWYNQYYSALEYAGCRRLEPYSCRHTTATRLAITEGIAPQTVQRIMRWSTTKMLDRYAHPDDTAVREASDTIRK